MKKNLQGLSSVVLLIPDKQKSLSINTVIYILQTLFEADFVAVNAKIA